MAENAEKVNYYTLGGAYQVSYNVKICFPAAAFIDKMVKAMSQREWKRLEFDHNNPEIKLNHAKKPAEWSYFIDASKKTQEDVWQWIDDWKDSSGNIIRYLLMYRTARESNLKEQRYFKRPEKCELKVVTIYIPAELEHAVENKASTTESSQPK